VESNSHARGGQRPKEPGLKIPDEGKIERAIKKGDHVLINSNISERIKEVERKRKKRESEGLIRTRARREYLRAAYSARRGYGGGKRADGGKRVIGRGAATGWSVGVRRTLLYADVEGESGK